MQLRQLSRGKAEASHDPRARPREKIMTDNEQQFEGADAAVTRAVTSFVNEIESIFGKWEDVVSLVHSRERAGGAIR